jgi:hypothetical protein
MDPDDVVEEAGSVGGSSEVTFISLNKPIWFYGLRNPAWLLPARPAQAKSIAFLAVACEQAPAGPRPEDDRGRLARAVPLFLAECCWFRLNLRPVAMIPAVKGMGPAMTDTEMPEEELFELADQGHSFAVTGMLKEDGVICDLSLTLWDLEGRAKVATFNRVGERYTLGQMALALCLQICDAFTDPAPPVSTWYKAPSETVIDGYLGSLSRGLSFYLADKKVLPANELVGESNLLQWMADFATSSPDLQVPGIMLIAGLIADRGMGSDLWKSFKTEALATIRAMGQRDPQSILWMLSPVLFKMYGEDDAYANRVTELFETGDQNMLAWLEALENAG